jgi:energy-coupling factor transporter ATP-binding protein EcfA2
MPTNDIPISFKDFSYTYQRATLPTLSELNFDIHKGEYLLVVGPSGCGKTTLGLCMIGALPKLLGGRTNGGIFLHGNKLDELSMHDICQSISMVFQNPDDQISNLVVEDELVFSMANLKYPRTDIEQRLQELLDLTGMEQYRLKYVFDLSGGQKQRVATASVLAFNPEILFLDDITSNLDPQNAQETLELLDEIREDSDITVIQTAHHFEDFIDRVDRVMLMDAGIIHFLGSPQEFVDKFALDLRDEWGLWIPQPTEICGQLREKGFSFPNLPINEDAAIDLLSPILDKTSTVRNISSRTTTKSVKDDDKSEIQIAVKDVSFVYPDGTVALNDVNFKIDRGEFVAILGQNGSGKSTLAMNIVSIYHPTTGDIIVGGINTKHVKTHEMVKRVAYVFQYPEYQFIKSSVGEEVSHGLLATGETEGVDEKSREYLEKVDLLEHWDKHPYSLSMGEKRRLSVVCMLITNPEIIILDEPTYGQDWKNSFELVTLLKDLNEYGKTIILISHDMRLVADSVPRVIVMREGYVSFDGSTYETFNQTDLLHSLSLREPPVCRISNKLLGRMCLNTDDFLQISHEMLSLRSSK